ncbi:MAG: hydantoinase [Fuerstiella sp.]|nr:hydantoinase [Fuerstiella sp.]
MVKEWFLSSAPSCPVFFMSQPWQFWIDVGGTFTDCIAITPEGELRQFKTLSSGVTKGTGADIVNGTITDPPRIDDPDDFWVGAELRLFSATAELLHVTTVSAFDADSGRLTLADGAATAAGDVETYELDLHVSAPVLAIRWLLRLPPSAECPPVRMRFGTTRGTNALLTRTGARTAFITTKGFGDVPLIGNQDRPDLFDLDIKKPEPLFSQVFEVDERMTADGAALCALEAAHQVQRLKDAGLLTGDFDSVAICLMNAYRNPVHEERLEQLVRQSGFTEVSRSSEVSPLIRFVPRCDTTVLDAYLNPVLRTYLNRIRGHLPGSDIQVMTSAGGLVGSHNFRGRDCILSGPAGGVVGFSKVAVDEGFTNAIGFDMGGTSTDVARFDGHFEIENETTKAGVRIMTPVLAIETVAAGGGSICGFDGVRLFVGPDSAGADPGPACYGAGGPLTVTDLNVFLGRVLPRYFPFRLNVQAVESRLLKLRSDMAATGAAPPGASLHQLAEGLLQIADDNMVQAIRRVSVARGYHPADHVLVSFGGAGGQHACSIARSLGIKKILIHPFAGILSAYGMGQADVRAIRQASVLQPLTDESLLQLESTRQAFAAQTRAEVVAQGAAEDQIQGSTLSLELRYRSTDSSLWIAAQPDADFRVQFESEHRRLFGYIRPEKEIEIASVRVETVGRSGDVSEIPVSDESGSRDTRIRELHSATTFWNGVEYAAVVHHRNGLRQGMRITGPAIICEPTSTIWIEPHCNAQITATGTVLIEVYEDEGMSRAEAASAAATPDPVLLEVLNNQFVSIAEQMGQTLRRTSTSTNVRERLDFSCALFDADGRLVVNAPHVPVHLGAMGETVRVIIDDHPDMQRGDVFVTNDPYRGGSHLPDVTVVTPVFVGDSPPGDPFADVLPERAHDDDSSYRPAFFVANRAHHAEIGGIVPGSMPPFSTNLAQEGILIRSRKLVDRGQSCEDEIQQLLAAGPFPSRAINDNLADLAAQSASNECGVQLLQSLVRRHSVGTVLGYMQHIQTAAAKKMRLCLSRLEDRAYKFEDRLDDGAKVSVAIRLNGDEATVDFTGTSGVHPGNLNANRAITTAAVLYSFRCLLNEDVPLNAGVLEPLTIVIPEGLLNPSVGTSPEDSPAIVGGNVETSQRIVDVLLGALGIAAASQGTMNNLTFGDDTFGYYETICGGAGATSAAHGADAIHTHMTNTRLTDPEVLEQRYPVRLRKFEIRHGSGGPGEHHGGNGIVREIEFLKTLQVSMLSQRRETNPPFGLQSAAGGRCGRNSLLKTSATDHQDLGGAFHTTVLPGDVIRIETPGGGGFGAVLVFRMTNDE